MDVKVDYAVAAARAVIASGEDLLSRAVRDAPIGPAVSDSGAQNIPGHPGLLRASGRLEYVVDNEVFPSSQAALLSLRAKIRGGESPRFSARVSFNTVYAARLASMKSLHGTIRKGVAASI